MSKVISIVERIRERNDPCACGECGETYEPDFLVHCEVTGSRVCWDCADKLETNYEAAQ